VLKYTKEIRQLPKAETILAKTMTVAGDEASYDAACKSVLASKDILVEKCDSELINMLEVLLSNDIDPSDKKEILENEFSIPMSITLEEEVLNMCNLSQGVKNKGIQIGRAEGRTEGIKEGTLASIKNLMETMKLSIQQAMDALKIPEADRAYYVNAINGK
jgi:predicted transposase YdaD